MNHIYRLVWSKARNMLIAVSELAGSHDTSGTPRRRRGGKSRTLEPRPLACAVALALGLAPALALALPSGGKIVSGQARISQSGTIMTVKQGSRAAIVDWQSFGVGANETVNFRQPGASSVVLNRVLGNNPSQIFGQLNANGQVFLVNPNGVYFAPGAEVNVGGLVASTLDISNSDFLSGNFRFSGHSDKGVVNECTITAADGGYVAFIGRTVGNDGTITTPGGTTALGAGGIVDLTLADNHLLTFKVSAAAFNAQARNGGVIRADGGRVVLTAHAKDALLRTVVNNTGVIEAHRVAEHNGVIELLGGDSGTTKVAGTMDASGGNGGLIETSGEHLKIGTAKIDAGQGGEWLVDPVDLTIDSTAANTISSTLNLGTDVTEQTTATTASGSGTQSSGTGDINVEAPITWSANSTLTLSAYHSINVDAAITATGANAGLVLTTNNNVGGTSSGGSLNINAPVTLSGSNVGLSIEGTGYTVINSVSALQNMSGNLTGHYALGSDLNDSNAAFTPIGTNKTDFTGAFEGLGHTISNLYLSKSSGDVGLFGVIGTKGVVRDVGLVGGSATGSADVGELAGINKGQLKNVFATGSVSGNGNAVGGLVGSNDNGTISDAYATGDVSNVGGYTGGLVGENNAGTIVNAYATGSVSASGKTARGTGGSTGTPKGLASNTHVPAKATSNYLSAQARNGTYEGGLVGYNANGTVSGAYATGNVTVSSNTVDGIGGLVGFNNSGAINNTYATGNVAGNSHLTGGLVGYNANGSIGGAYALGNVSGSNAVGGVVGSNNGGTLTDTYWDTTTSGTGTGVGGGTATTGATGLSTAQLSSALPAGFNSGVWDNAGNQTTPYLLANASFDTVSGSVLLGSDGSSTPAHYGVILNMTQMQNINSTGLNDNYVLGDSLNDNNESFTPIGNRITPFNGTFDGLGHTISNLYIASGYNFVNQSGDKVEVDMGLFGEVGTGGVIRNVGLVGGNVSGNPSDSHSVGELVGANFGVVSNSYATGSVSGWLNVGGLVGKNHGTISASYASGSVSGEWTVGGLAGGDDGVITNSYATGNVGGSTGPVGALLVGADGGLVGQLGFYGVVSSSYATGRVSGENDVGGLVGLSSGTIVNAYATGNVSGSNEVGGLVGRNGWNNYIYGVVSTSYATGRVSGSKAVGGVVGSNAYGTLTDTYWDTTTSGTGTGVGGGTISGATGLTDAQMHTQANFAGFDFTNVWTSPTTSNMPLLKGLN